MKAKNNLKITLIISFIFQLLFLCIFNFVFLEPGKVSVEAIKYSEISDFKKSVDNNFAAYLSAGNLNIINEGNKSVIKVSGADTVNCYRWLPGRDIVIFAEENHKAGSIALKTYDAQKNYVRSYPVIKDIPKISTVNGIELSTITNIVYMSVKVNNSALEIYKYDIMDNIGFIMKLPLNTIIKELNFSDKIVFQNDKKNISIWDGNSKKTFTFFLEKEGLLLGIDKDDNINVGEYSSNGFINKILIYKADNGNNKIYKIELLNSPLKGNNIPKIN